jgi:hypothetical protein
MPRSLPITRFDLLNSDSLPDIRRVDDSFDRQSDLDFLLTGVPPKPLSSDVIADNGSFDIAVEPVIVDRSRNVVCIDIITRMSCITSHFGDHSGACERR